MTSSFASQIPSNSALTTGGIIAGFQQALDRKYSGVLAAAQREWERCYSYNDPSDACVSVRISGITRGSHALRST